MDTARLHRIRTVGPPPFVAKPSRERIRSERVVFRLWSIVEGTSYHFRTVIAIQFYWRAIACNACLVWLVANIFLVHSQGMNGGDGCIGITSVLVCGVEPVIFGICGTAVSHRKEIKLQCALSSHSILTHPCMLSLTLRRLTSYLYSIGLKSRGARE